MSERQTPNIILHTANPTNRPHIPQTASKKRRRTRLSMGERLLRNSAIACAVLLGILALRSVEQPWAKKAVSGVEQALSMHIDLDDSLGGLTFVQKLVPESALVFFHVSGEQAYIRPIQGDVCHAWSEEQPWVLFDCDAGERILACRGGTVSAVSQLSDGTWGMMIDHGEGFQSVYAYMQAPEWQIGQSVRQGDLLAYGTGKAYYELRRDGISVNPTEKMRL